MRTTLTIDDDVLERARKLASELGQPFRTVINEALRQGLRSAELPPKKRRYQTQPHAMGLRRGRNLDNIAELLARLEGEEQR